MLRRNDSSRDESWDIGETSSEREKRLKVIGNDEYSMYDDMDSAAISGGADSLYGSSGIGDDGTNSVISVISNASSDTNDHDSSSNNTPFDFEQKQFTKMRRASLTFL